MTLSVTALALAALAPTLSPAQDLQIRAKEIVLADGTRVANGVLAIEGGKIARVGAGTLDSSKPWIHHDGVLTAGLVACQTESGAWGGEASDTTRSLMPEARLLHSFSPGHSDFERALEAGITTVVLTPTEENLVGGITAVVKTHGGTVVAREGHLAVGMTGRSLSSGATNFVRFFSAEPPAVAENGGLENTSGGRRGVRPPTSYAGAVRMLDAQLTDARGAFERVKNGQLPVLLFAWDRNEVVRAARFAARHGLKGALRGAPLAGEAGVLEALQESGLGVVLGPFEAGHRTRSLTSVAALHAAGVPVGFALDAPGSHPDDFRLGGALAVQAGADAGEVLRSMTVVGAEIAGAADRVGSLEAGKDADFVLWSGDPLDLSSRVESVWVDGDIAWRNQ